MIFFQGCIILLLLNCLRCRSNATGPPAGTHKEIYSWVKEEFAVPSGGNKIFPFEVIKNDTVEGHITLTQGERITLLCFIDDENLEKWKSNQSCEFIYSFGNSLGDNIYLRMNFTGNCNFVVLNHLGYTIWVRAEIIVSRWEK